VVAKSIRELDQAIVKCKKCPRLVSWRQEVAVTKRKSYKDETYWGKPVPGFGDENPTLLILGLAPGAHGANRTGRIFTGDSSGDWLYRALHKVGVAKIATSTSIDDGQKLKGVRISCAVRCVPPDNKPSTEEKETCSKYLDQELALLTSNLKSILALGSIAWSSTLSSLEKNDFVIPKPRPKFSHGAEFVANNGKKKIKVVGSYHPSQQNTFTGKLNEKMLENSISVALADNISA
jgi:uracil-DNA glycosylase family 4